MANTLQENIQGRHVVIREDAVTLDYSSIEQRVFLVEGGFGASSFTMGTAVFGRTPIDGEEFRIDGYDIERYATVEEIAMVGGVLTTGERKALEDASA